MCECICELGRREQLQCVVQRVIVIIFYFTSINNAFLIYFLPSPLRLSSLPPPPPPLIRIKGAPATPYATPLTCGEPVEFTVYDFLQGIARRKEHKPYPEPEVAMIFKKSDSDTAVDLVDVELALRKAYLEVRTEVEVLMVLMQCTHT